jgi:hypothetical protein
MLLAVASLINGIGLPVPVAVQVFVMRNTLSLAPKLFIRGDAYGLSFVSRLG